MNGFCRSSLECALTCQDFHLSLMNRLGELFVFGFGRIRVSFAFLFGIWRESLGELGVFTFRVRSQC